jgi:hypothetical protein
MIVNLKDASGRSHNFIDAIFGQIGIPMDRLKVGDILKLLVLPRLSSKDTVVEVLGKG